MRFHFPCAAKIALGFATLFGMGCGQGDLPRRQESGGPWAPAPDATQNPAPGVTQNADIGGPPSLTPDAPVPEPLPGVAPAPASRIRLLGTLDLAGWVPEQAELVGVAVAPDGERYVLDSASGLYHLGEAGSERVLDTRTLDERYGLSPELELTDVVSYGPDRFLITAENDGYLLDLWAGTMQSHFCYLPPIGPEESFEQDPLVPMSVSQVLSASGVPVKQRTESVAVNSRTGEIFAQPQTLRLDAAAPGSDPAAPDPAVAGSELFVFDSAGGEPSRVQPVDADFLAGGMVAWQNRLFLGFGAAMFEMSVDGPRWIGSFPPGTVVTGIALDVDGSLLVLDGPARRLLRSELTP